MARPPLVGRRQFLSGGAIVGSALAFDSTLPVSARTISGDMPWQPGEANRPDEIEAGPWRFFTADEARFVDAAIARLIPSDDLGPGAKEAGVTTFLDRQLAGPYGQASRWYMRGPWKKGEPTQGYQTRLTPAELYRTAIKEIDAQSAARFEGRDFSDLDPDQQDRLLSDLEEGRIELQAVDAKAFFEMFLQNTVEGFFSDPIYGGNRGMVGWSMIGFPGARYDYRPYVGQHGQKLDLPPVGIKGRPGWKPA